MLERTADRITQATSAKPAGPISSQSSFQAGIVRKSSSGPAKPSNESQCERELRIEGERSNKKAVNKAIRDKGMYVCMYETGACSAVVGQLGYILL